MSSQNHQSGEPKPIMIPVALATEIPNVGAPVAITSDLATVASAETWVTDLATTRRNFCAKFAGFSAQIKDADEYVWQNGDAKKLFLRTDCGGVVRLPVASGTYVLGDLIGPDKASGNALLDDVFEIVTDPAQAVAKVVGGAGTDPGYVFAEVLSRKFAASLIGNQRPGSLKMKAVAGAAAGNVTVTGISTDDELISVIQMDIAVDTGDNATGNKVQNVVDLTSEFSITATNTINNTGGTSTASDVLLVMYFDRS